MPLVEISFELGLAATALLVLRILLTPLLIYNCAWSFKGFTQLLRGIAFPSSLYQTPVFMFSFAALGYNLLSFFGRGVSEWSLPWSLSLQCTILLASVTAFIGRRLAITIDFERFYWLFASNNLDIAVRAAEMNQADPEFTESAIEVAETTLSMKLAKRAFNGSSD